MYIEPILKIPGLDGSYGYADDILRLYIANSLAELIPQMQADYQKLFDLGLEMGSPFNPEKTEVQFFIRKKKDFPAIPFQLARPMGPHTRWLGVILDQKLGFKEYVDYWATKAKKIYSHLRSLSSFTHGAPPGPMRTAARTCALSVTMFGSQIWYMGKKNLKGRPARYKTQMNRLDRVIAQAAKAVVPAYKTIPNIAMIREAGFAPASVMLEDAWRKSAIRI